MGVGALEWASMKSKTLSREDEEQIQKGQELPEVKEVCWCFEEMKGQSGEFSFLNEKKMDDDWGFRQHQSLGYFGRCEESRSCT